MFRVLTRDGWTSALMPRAEADELASLHPGAIVVDRTEHPSVTQAPRLPRNANRESPEQLLARLEREVWG